MSLGNNRGRFLKELKFEKMRRKHKISNWEKQVQEQEAVTQNQFPGSIHIIGRYQYSYSKKRKDKYLSHDNEKARPCVVVGSPEENNHKQTRVVLSTTSTNFYKNPKDYLFVKATPSGMEEDSWLNLKHPNFVQPTNLVYIKRQLEPEILSNLLYRLSQWSY